MISIKVYTHDGNWWYTRINGTKEDAEKYYVGKWFNIGVEEDKMVRVTHIEFLESEGSNV